MNRHPTLGQHITLVTWDELTKDTNRLVLATLLRKIQDQPTITGFLLFHSLSIGERPNEAFMPTGPDCTFETWQDALGVPLGGKGVPQSNPRYASMWAPVPTYTPAGLAQAIQEADKAGYHELQRVWVGNKKIDIGINDRLLDPTTEKICVVLATEKNGHDILLCSAEDYSCETEDDPTSPSKKRVRGSQFWFWTTLRGIVSEGFSILEQSGIPACRFVMTEAEEIDEDNPNEMQQLKVSQIKVGDKLIRENDHLGRHDSVLYVRERVKQKGPTCFFCSSQPEGPQTLWYATSLSAENYRIVERDGNRIGRFFVKYW